MRRFYAKEKKSKNWNAINPFKIFFNQNLKKRARIGDGFRVSIPA